MKVLIFRGIKFLLVVFIFFLVLVVTPYVLAYRDKIIPGVRLKKLGLGNRPQQEALVSLRAYLNLYEKEPITIIIEERKIKFSQAELGLTLDPEATVKKAFALGRQGNPLERVYENYILWREGIEIKPAYKINRQKFLKTISELAKSVDIPAVEAQFVWQENALVVLPSSKGEKVDQEALSTMITTYFGDLDFKPLDIPTLIVEPKIKSDQLATIKEEVSELVTNPPRLKYESTVLSSTPEQVLSVLEFKPGGDSFKPETGYKSEALKNYFASLASKIDIEAKPGIFNFDGDKVTSFELPEDGRSLNIDKAVWVYSQSLVSLKSAVEIDLPVEVTRAKGAANEYGIRELLGEGTTNFKGSSQGRIHNIGLASSRLRGILVPPEEVFSFNESVGEISAETGYDQAYIIKERRTILGTGGGVCQVSTTLFRAAFYAGLSTVERYPHAYRVHYYEPPVGLDATVYAPYTDLKFKNDTPNYILIYSYFDSKTYTLTFKIFGTPDGREVKVEGPIIHSQTPPPSPVYQDDASLAPGEVKQIDFASPGAKVSLKRLVLRNGEELIDEKLYSNYTPWQAVYLVGPKEEDDED